MNLNSREDRIRLVELLDDGRMPEAFKRRFIDTGVIDGTLWPLLVPWRTTTSQDKP